MTALTEWQRYLCILVWYSSQLRDPLAQHLRIWLSSFFSCLVLWPIYWSEVRYGYSIFCNGFSAPDTITLRQCWKGKNKHERRFHILVQLTVASVHLAGISVKVSSTALSKVICLVSFLMAQVTFNFKMSSGVKNWKSRWWLNENQLSGKFKLFIFLFCFNRTHHNIFPDDFTVDQLTILPENIEKINWVLHISTWKKTWYGDHNVNPFFQKEDHRRLLYYVCITFKFSNINPSPLILQLQKFFLTFKVIMTEISSQ